MWMEFTPKDWLMMRVGLIFREGEPDPEDAWVRAYLREHQLEPRHQLKEERNGTPCDVFYFGQCYLGQHVHAIQALYQKGLERSFLIEKLHALRRDTDPTPVAWPTTLDEPGFEQVLPALAEALHEQVNFDIDAEGYLALTLDPDLVRHELSRLTPASAPHSVCDMST